MNKNTGNTQIRRSAEAFVAAGFNLIELYPMTDSGLCTCWKGAGCTQPGKHPVAKKAERPDFRVHDQLFDVKLEAGAFDHGHGVLLDGTCTLVVDVDARNGGLRGYAQLVADFPEIAGAGFVVETGSGGGSKHLYFTVPADMFFRSKLDAYVGIDFKTTGWVVAPGSKHKSGGLYRTVVGSVDEIDAAPEGLLAALERPAPKVVDRSAYADTEVDLGEILDMLAVIDNTEYDAWWAVGSALYSALGDAGYAVWNDWSSSADNYDAKALDEKWEAECVQGKYGLGLIIDLAHKAGWQPRDHREMTARLASFVPAPNGGGVIGELDGEGTVALVTEADGAKVGYVTLADGVWNTTSMAGVVRFAGASDGLLVATPTAAEAARIWARTGRAVVAYGGDIRLAALGADLELMGAGQ